MKPLLEIISPQCKILSESVDETTKERIMRLGVKWQHAGIVNANKRRYSKEILQREIERLTPLMRQGKVYGSSFHPKDDGEVDDVSHLWESAKMERDGTCLGTIKVLPTTKGRNVQIVVKASGWLGMSSRGYGTTTAKEETLDGKKITVEEVNSDYVLKSPGDFVLDPSVTDAGVLEMIREGIWWATSEGNKIDEERRYELALKAGFKGSLKDYTDGINTKGDETKLSALYRGALRAGYRKGYLEFRKEYLRRK